jgi:hypothetical protein
MKRLRCFSHFKMWSFKLLNLSAYSCFEFNLASTSFKYKNNFLRNKHCSNIWGSYLIGGKTSEILTLMFLSPQGKVRRSNFLKRHQKGLIRVCQIHLSSTIFFILIHHSYLCSSATIINHSPALNSAS